MTLKPWDIFTFLVITAGCSWAIGLAQAVVQGAAQ